MTKMNTNRVAVAPVVHQRLKDKFGAACGLAAVAAFCVLYPVAALEDSSYVFFDDYLSDLGVGPGAWAFNSALILSGALVSLFAVFGMWKLLGSSTDSLLGSGFLAMSGVFLVCIGIFTEDFGDTHTLFSFAFFITLLITLGVVTYTLYRSRCLGRFGLVITGAAFALGLALLGIGANPATETLAVFTALVWGALVAGRMLIEPPNLT